MAVAGYDMALTLLHPNPNPNPNPNPKPKRKPKPNPNQVRYGAHPLRCDARWPSRRALPRAPAGRLHLDDRPRLHLVGRVQRGRQGPHTRLLERCCPRVHDRRGARQAGRRRLYLPYTQLHPPCIYPASPLYLAPSRSPPPPGARTRPPPPPPTPPPTPQAPRRRVPRVPPASPPVDRRC